MATTTGLTSTTAPGKVFETRTELAAHYQTQWHQYNLKRRQAGLPMLLEQDFEARLAAAQALRNETREAGKNHLKADKMRKDNSKKQHKKNKNKKNGTGVSVVSQVPSYNRIQEDNEESEPQPLSADEDEDEAVPMDEEVVVTTDEPIVETMVSNENGINNDAKVVVDGKEGAEEAPTPETVEIDPLQSLFDRHVSATVEGNVDRMYRKYGFFVPDREFCSDLEGLVGYLHEKVKLGHMCIYCHRVFTTWQGCVKHMISKQHTKLRYESGIDLEDLSVFYDFKEENEQFLQGNKKNETRNDEKDMEVEPAEEGDAGEDGEDGWEDVSDDEEVMDEGKGEDDDDDDDDYSEFEEEIARMGFDVTPLGELVFPDGRIVGHRSLRRYYKQRAPRTEDERASVQAARLAAGERLYRGRVYQLGGGATPTGQNPIEASRAKALALSTAGIAPGLAAGRAGKGILVSGSNVGSGFTQVSVYRFRAAMKKQRRQDAFGKRLEDRTKQNINRMDKKHNRLMNNVSVAHAKR